MRPVPAALNLNMEFDALSGRVISAAIRAHKELGPGFLESIYHSAMLLQLRKEALHVDTQREVNVRYDGEVVGTHRLDLVVDDVLVEVKAVKEFDSSHVAQVMSYLKATGLKTGLLLNFGRSILKVKRVVL